MEKETATERDFTVGDYVFSQFSVTQPETQVPAMPPIPAKEICDLFCTAVRSRDKLRKAIENENLAEAGFAFGWLDATLTEIGQTLLPNEARKQFVKSKAAGGGGEKPR